MIQLGRDKQGAVLAALLMILALVPAPAQTQGDATAQAVGLVRQAMDAYGNLEFDSAKNTLEQALAMASQIDTKTLANAYASLGMVMSGGFADNATAQNNFVIALCLDSAVGVNPLYSTPEIDLLFTMAKGQASPESCPSVLSGITQPGGGDTGGDMGGSVLDLLEPSIAPCGDYMPMDEQKQKYELPFYIELSPEMRGQVNRLTVKYAFDSSEQYTEIKLPQRGAGFGAMLSCDLGQIHIYDPSTIAYFIEGLDATGQVVCGHGTQEMPIEVLMMPDAEPIPSIAGMLPKECAPCPPWEPDCHPKDTSFLPKENEGCLPDVGCADGLTCSDLGICAKDDVKEDGARGPSKFYVNVGGGAGFGYMYRDITIRQMDYTADPEGDAWEGVPRGVIEEIKKKASETDGTAWSGIPLRLAVGFFVSPKLSLEVSGRFDVYVTSTNEPQSCWDAAGGSVEGLQDLTTCSIPIATGNPEDAEAIARLAVAHDVSANEIMVKEYQYAWLVNARLRYRLLSKGVFALSLFGGLGYGHVQYRIAGSDTPYFPLPGGFNIEIGPGFSFFFTDHFGLNIEVPIDVVAGDGFALNFDLNVGLGFGF